MKRDSTGSKEDELLTMMEEIQEENEKLQEKNTKLREESKSLQDQASEAQQTISQLSSENSILRNALQKKSETIVSLNAQIGRLSASDLVLKQNEQLERQNRDLRISEQRARQEAADVILAAKKEAAVAINRVKTEYEKKEMAVERRETEVSERETAVSVRENAFQTKVIQQAQLMIQAKNKRLTTDFRRLRKGYSCFVFLTVFYGAFVTAITACKTKVFVDDTAEFVETIGWICFAIYNLADNVGRWAGGLGHMIPHALVSAIVYQILYILVTGLCIGIISVVLLHTIRAYIKFIRETQADEMSLFVAVIDLACVVFFAEELNKAVPLNLLLLMMLIFLICTVLRGVMEMNNKEIRNNILIGSGMLVGCLGGVVAMVHFFGAWGIAGAFLVSIIISNKK